MIQNEASLNDHPQNLIRKREVFSHHNRMALNRIFLTFYTRVSPSSNLNKWNIMKSFSHEKSFRFLLFIRIYGSVLAFVWYFVAAHQKYHRNEFSLFFFFRRSIKCMNGGRVSEFVEFLSLWGNCLAFDPLKIYMKWVLKESKRRKAEKNKGNWEVSKRLFAYFHCNWGI